MAPDAQDDVVVSRRVEAVPAPLQLGDALQADDDLRRGLRQRLAGANENRDAGPAPVFDLELERDERLRVRVRLHALDVAISGVLASYRLARFDSRHRPEDVLAPSRNRVVVAGGRLHRDERENLQQVVLHDVADRPDRVVEAAAILDAEVLGHRDLHRGDVLAVPDRLEHRVREAHVHDVLHRLLPQEVVDAEEPLLGEDRGQAPVEIARRREVGPERLLDDEPALVADQTCSRELLGDLVEHRRRRCEIEDRERRVRENVAQALVHRALLRVPTDVLEPAEELRERRVVHIVLGRADRLRRMLPQLVVGDRAAPHSDHRTREQPLLREGVQRRERAPAREIARDAKDDEGVGDAGHGARKEWATKRSISTPSSRSSTGIRSFAEWMSVAASSVSIVFSGK